VMPSTVTMPDDPEILKLITTALSYEKLLFTSVLEPIMNRDRTNESIKPLTRRADVSEHPADNVFVMDLDSGHGVWMDKKTASDVEKRRDTFLLSVQDVHVPCCQSRPFMSWTREDDGSFVVSDHLWHRYGEGSTLKEALGACIEQINDFADDVSDSTIKYGERLKGQAATLARAWLGKETMDGDLSTEVKVKPYHAEPDDKKPNTRMSKTVFERLGLPTDIVCTEEGDCLYCECPYHEEVTDSISLCTIPPGGGSRGITGPCVPIFYASVYEIKKEVE